MTWPSAMPGANTSQVAQIAMRWRHMYQSATISARIRPP